MATTRDFKSLGIWATNANTTIPAEPVVGTSYRDETTTEVNNELGFLYGSPPDSSEDNQKLFVMSSFTDTIDKHGIPGWSDEVDYEVPAIVWGSDDNFYVALLDSGPSGAGAQDPITATTYWQLQTSAETLALALADTTPGNEGAILVGTTNETVQAKLESLPVTNAVASGAISSTGVLSSSDNLASVTKLGTGEYEIFFTTSVATTYFVSVIVITTARHYGTMRPSSTSASFIMDIYSSSADNHVDNDFTVVVFKGN